jgi:Zn-dependent peptidase ImmA (M78 family)
MQTSDLLALAHDHGHSVYTMPLTANKAFAIEDRGKCYIAIRDSLTQTQKKEALAHELGHCEYGGFYYADSPVSLRAKCEAKATRWATIALMPLDELRAAIRAGNTELWQLAEVFGVSPRFVEQALIQYAHMGLTVQEDT